MVVEPPLPQKSMPPEETLPPVAGAPANQQEVNMAQLQDLVKINGIDMALENLVNQGMSPEQAVAALQGAGVDVPDLAAPEYAGVEEPQVRRAEQVPQAAGGNSSFDFSPFEPIAQAIQAGDMTKATQLKNQLSPVQQHVLERASYTEAYTAETAARDASAFMDTERQQEMRRQTPAYKAAEDAQAATAEKRLIAMDEIKSVRKTITEMVGDGDTVPPHPGFSGSVGRKNYAYAFGLIPEFLGGKEPFAGTSEADFYPYLKQLEGGAFLRAFERIKGGGQITEIEGQKATEAIIRASSSQSEVGFKKSMKDFVDVISAVESRMMETDAKRSGSAPASAQPAAAAPPKYVVGESYTDGKGQTGIFDGYSRNGTPTFSRPSR